MSPLIKTPKPKADASVRLFILPHAGGSPTAFMPWLRRLPEDMELNLLALPGRDYSPDVSLVTNIETLLDDLLNAFETFDDTPWIFLGYSNGAAIGFELARRLEARGDNRVKHVCVAAKSAPHLASQTFGHLPDDELADWLRGYGNMPEEMLSDPQIRKPFFRVLRADLGLVENVPCDTKTRLQASMTVFHGKDDPTNDLAGMQAWQALVADPITLHQFDAGHFFMQSHSKDMISALSQLGEETSV